MDLPAPPTTQRAIIHEDTVSPLHFRKPDDTVRLIARVALGADIRSAESHEGGGAFAADLFYGAAIRFQRASDVGLWTEAGYSYSRFHDHLLVIGAGPVLFHSKDGFLGDTSKVALVPHLVVGHIDGRFGYGLRTSVFATFLGGIELAHQVVFVDSAAIHEVHLMFTVPYLVSGT